MATRQDFKHPQNQGLVVTRSVKQLALLEPCAIELERQWQEQKSVQSPDPEVPLTRGVLSVEDTLKVNRP